MKIPSGFQFAGIQAGIKPNRKDLALVYSQAPCSAAGCFTRNTARAAPVLDAEARLPSAGVHAVVVNSGNANALTGPTVEVEKDPGSQHPAARTPLSGDPRTGDVS